MEMSEAELNNIRKRNIKKPLIIITVLAAIAVIIILSIVFSGSTGG